MTRASLLITDIKRAWSFILTCRKDVAMIGIIDLVFFLCFAAAHYFIIRMLPALRQVNEIIAQNAAALRPMPGQTGPAFPVAAFQGAFGTILANLSLFVLSIFAAWCIVEGYAWYRTHGLLGKKVKPGTYLLRFSILSLVWLVLAALVSFIALRATTFLAVASLSGIPSWAGPAFIGILVLLAGSVVIIGYDLCAAHALTRMPLWETMKKKAAALLAGFILVAASLLATVYLGKAIPVIAPLGIVFLVIPSVVFARILLVRSG